MKSDSYNVGDEVNVKRNSTVMQAGKATVIDVHSSDDMLCVRFVHEVWVLADYVEKRPS